MASHWVVMPPTLAEQVITLMVATNDLTSWSWLPPGKTKTDVIIVVCIFIGMVTFLAFKTRGQIKTYRQTGQRPAVQDHGEMGGGG